MTDEKKPHVHELRADPYLAGWESYRTFPLDGKFYEVMGEDGVVTEARYEADTRTVVLKHIGAGPAKLMHWRRRGSGIF